jgi:hypothetical protein
MLSLKKLVSHVSRHKLKSMFVAALGALSLSCVSYVATGVIGYGGDHFTPRLHQLTYRLTNWYKKRGADIVVLYSCDWATAGNVITLHNQLNSKHSQLRSEQGMEVVSVSYRDEEFLIPDAVASISIQAEYGQMIFFRSGFYTYVSEIGKISDDHDEEFLVAMTGPNLITEATTLHVDAYNVTQTANLMSDYGNQTHGQNYELNGRKGYQTPKTTGSMLIGWNEQDLLAGSNSNDAIFGWAEDDYIIGRKGNDVLAGEGGENVLVGGKNGDVFLIGFHHAGNEMMDHIKDFSPSEGDVLFLFDVITKYSSSSPESFIRLSATETALVVLVNTDGKGNDFFPVVTLEAHSEFNPMEQSAVELIASGHFQLG